MANNIQMNEDERGIFKLDGITGMLVAVVLLLTILGILVTNAVIVQHNEATNAYTINQDLQGLKANSSKNHKHYQLVGNINKE